MECQLEQLQALVENSSDALSLVDNQGLILYASNSTSDLLGYPPEELLGRNNFDFMHSEDREQSSRAFASVLSIPRSHSRIEARVCRKNGGWLWVESTACNLLDEPRVAAVVVNHREISERIAENEHQKRRIEELSRCNVALESLAHTVAHDLKEPLRTISICTSLLLRQVQFGEAEQELGWLIVSGAKRMTALIDSLLSAAVNEYQESFGAVDLGSVVQQALENISASITASSAEVAINGPLPTVYGNQSDLIRLFQNLLGNAVKYRSALPLKITIEAERAGPDWLVKVRDNGRGIAKEHHRRVFGRFTRLHSDIPGTGIGLTAAKRIVEEQGGSIWVESEGAGGSTFCFTFAVDPAPGSLASAVGAGWQSV